jgi:hypothetical protein
MGQFASERLVLSIIVKSRSKNVVQVPAISIRDDGEFPRPYAHFSLAIRFPHPFVSI